MNAKDFLGVPISVGDKVLISLARGFSTGTITEIEEDWWSEDRLYVTVVKGNETSRVIAEDVVAIAPIINEHPEKFI